eukprot:CAMPEP_0119047364 /NCGR_PEP_ID=MMETSP1177-20130426/52781_1 /TAXON_ID=2985 /ORGANISM="Ochromonas sp, Strain CCMP1899" /LENGTH=165 /DNA_ID=CAMNT_0007021893 /DNA_START=1 /DNA_END=494 /DNA_ORIENTATION=+
MQGGGSSRLNYGTSSAGGTGGPMSGKQVSSNGMSQYQSMRSSGDIPLGQSGLRNLSDAQYDPSFPGGSSSLQENFAIQNEDFPPLSGDRSSLKHDSNGILGSVMNGGGLNQGHGIDRLRETSQESLQYQLNQQQMQLSGQSQLHMPMIPTVGRGLAPQSSVVGGG